MVRPLGPSMNAGLSCKRAACRRMYSVTVTSGIVTAGLSLLMIIALPRSQRRLDYRTRHRTAVLRMCQMRVRLRSDRSGLSARRACRFSDSADVTRMLVEVVAVVAFNDHMIATLLFIHRRSRLQLSRRVDLSPQETTWAHMMPHR